MNEKELRQKARQGLKYGLPGAYGHRAVLDLLDALDGARAELDRTRAELVTLRNRISESTRVDKRPGDVCTCGHARKDHIYDEWACRPGYCCAAVCEKFTLADVRETS